MPQFDTSTFPSNIFWFAICLLITFSFTRFYFLPRIIKTILKRENLFNTKQQVIDTNSDTIQELETKHNTKEQAVYDKVTNIRKQSILDTEEEKVNALNDFNKQNKQKLQEIQLVFKKEMSTLKETAFKSITENIAILLLQKTTKGNIDTKKIKTLASKL